MNTAFIAPLLDWYNLHAAELPWRANRDPYRVWLSEMMLQQTQVATVIPYFERFTERFPTVQKLADADQEAVLKMWEGLGYYSRARNLHKAAQQVVNDYAGQFPPNAAELQRLRGVGRYTAGAIASIAFNEAVPVLDGNVMRVFARLFDLADDVSLPATQAKLWDLAEKLVPDGAAGAYNQALMELGRTICKPRNPLCADCPIQAHCLAFQQGSQAERPVKKKKAPTPHYDVTAGVIRNAEGQVLITRRPEDALLGGLWEFPGGKQEAGETLEECLRRELREELGISVSVGELFMRVKHAFTHFKITLHVFECLFEPSGGEPQALGCSAWRWIGENGLEDFAFGAADRQVIALLKSRKGMLF